MVVLCEDPGTLTACLVVGDSLCLISWWTARTRPYLAFVRQSWYWASGSVNKRLCHDWGEGGNCDHSGRFLWNGFLMKLNSRGPLGRPCTRMASNFPRGGAPRLSLFCCCWVYFRGIQLSFPSGSPIQAAPLLRRHSCLMKEWRIVWCISGAAALCSVPLGTCEGLVLDAR